MPQLAPIVLKDYEAADHTFTPVNIDGGVASLVNSTGVPIGDQVLTYSSTKTASGKRKALLKLVLPVVQDVVVAGISKPTVVRTAYVEMSFTFDSTSNAAERHDALGLAWSLLGSTTAPLVIGDLSAPY